MMMSGPSPAGPCDRQVVADLVERHLEHLDVDALGLGERCGDRLEHRGRVSSAQITRSASPRAGGWYSVVSVVASVVSVVASVVSGASVVSVAASVVSVPVSPAESLVSSSLPHAAPTRAATAAKAIKRRDARMVSPPQEVMVPAGAGEVVVEFTVVRRCARPDSFHLEASAAEAKGAPLPTLRKPSPHCKKFADVLSFLAEGAYSALTCGSDCRTSRRSPA
jgi:hypothetical protein